MFLWIWGHYSWGEETELFARGWWFDAFGHILSAFVWAFMVLYWKRIYSPGAYIVTNRFDLTFDIIAKVTLGEIVFWEFLIEFMWDIKIQPDYASWLAKAQKGAADNILDIVFTILAASAAMALWGLYGKFYKKFYPNEAEQDMILEAKENAKQLGQKLIAMKKAHRKHAIKELRKTLRTKIKNPNQDQSL